MIIHNFFESFKLSIPCVLIIMLYKKRNQKECMKPFNFFQFFNNNNMFPFEPYEDIVPPNFIN